MHHKSDSISLDHSKSHFPTQHLDNVDSLGWYPKSVATSWHVATFPANRAPVSTLLSHAHVLVLVHSCTHKQKPFPAVIMSLQCTIQRRSLSETLDELVEKADSWAPSASRTPRVEYWRSHLSVNFLIVFMACSPSRSDPCNIGGADRVCTSVRIHKHRPTRAYIHAYSYPFSRQPVIIFSHLKSRIRTKKIISVGKR